MSFDGSPFLGPSLILIFIGVLAGLVSNLSISFNRSRTYFFLDRNNFLLEVVISIPKKYDNYLKSLISNFVFKYYLTF
jgi:hypothetical protein